MGIDEKERERAILDVTSEPKLELIKEFRPSELVAFSRFPLWVRVLFRVQEVNPTLRRMERTIVYRYENANSESRS